MEGISAISPDIYILNEFSTEIDSLDLQNETPQTPYGEGVFRIPWTQLWTFFYSVPSYFYTSSCAHASRWQENRFT